MNNLIKALQAVDGVQNASLQDVQSMHNRLEESLTAVNATMNEKVKEDKYFCTSVCKRFCTVANVFNTIKAFLGFLSLQRQGCFWRATSLLVV